MPFQLTFCMLNSHKTHFSSVHDDDVPLLLFYAHNYKENISLVHENNKYVCFYKNVFLPFFFSEC